MFFQHFISHRLIHDPAVNCLFKKICHFGFFLILAGSLILRLSSGFTVLRVRTACPPADPDTCLALRGLPDRLTGSPPSSEEGRSVLIILMWDEETDIRKGKWFAYHHTSATKWGSRDSHLGQKASYSRLRNRLAPRGGVCVGVCEVSFQFHWHCWQGKRGYEGDSNLVFLPHCAALLGVRSGQPAQCVGKGSMSGPRGIPSPKPFRERCHKVDVSKIGR